MRNIRIGDYLVEEGHITPEQLQQVLQRQRESTDQKKFGEVIVEMGFMSDIKFAQALSVKLQTPFVDLNNVEVDGEIARMVPQDQWAVDGFTRKNGKELRNREYWEKLHAAKAGLLVIPEAERYSEWSERLKARIEEHISKENEDV